MYTSKLKEQITFEIESEITSRNKKGIITLDTERKSKLRVPKGKYNVIFNSIIENRRQIKKTTKLKRTNKIRS